MTDMHDPQPGSRAEARRAQIIDAATACFLQYGFHGASIAAISRQAGMSPGHIYHYFTDKEAIVAAIVNADLARLKSFTARWRDPQLDAAASRRLFVDGLRLRLELPAVRLRVEILAEATRNPAVARIVQQADDFCNRQMRQAAATLIGPHTPPGVTADDLVELVATFSEGLIMRSIANPALDAARSIERFDRALAALMEQD